MEVIKLFARILAYILIGNTDAHLKNFAMFHDGTQLKLTPQYDVVASAYFIPFKTLALEMNGKKNFDLNRIKPKDIVDFAFNRNGFNLNGIIYSTFTACAADQNTNAGFYVYLRNGNNNSNGDDITIYHNGATVESTAAASKLHASTNTSNISTCILYWDGSDYRLY
jgi:hypothetical protein